MPSLDKKQKNKVKVCLTLVIVSLLLRRVDEETGKEGMENPAVNQCVKLCDELLNSESDSNRQEMARRVDSARRKLTKKVADVGTHIGLIGSMRFLCGPTFKSKPGTRFDYIRGQMSKNLILIEQTIPMSETSIKDFVEKIKVVVQEI